MSEPDDLSPEQPGDEDPFTPTEAQTFLGLTPQTFWRGVKTGYIPPPSYPMPRTPRWTRGQLRRHREATRRTPIEAKEMRRRARLAHLHDSEAE
jgi:hypothetical protein